ncbi:MAG: lysophospholipid acyltransferase family protein [Termitinemataceae bacterium]|nr:MAG: lysophospholipid acyltransferase family protein [Termitinemataceae bacterium]
MRGTIEDMPHIKNYPLYFARIVSKLLSFLYFGLSTLFLCIFIFPVLTVFVHPHKKFLKRSRRFVNSSFRTFTIFMNLIGCAKLETDDRNPFRNLGGKIVIANHPSLLDVVMLISLIPNADCIVNAGLMKNIVRGVIRRLYILNSLNFDDMLAACKNTLDEGNALIIFPEGTRTPRGSDSLKFKKGAARISIASAAPIVCVHIGGTDKFGLGKGDPLMAYNRMQKYLYKIKILCEVDPVEFSGLENQIAVKRMNDKLQNIYKNINED